MTVCVGCRCVCVCVPRAWFLFWTRLLGDSAGPLRVCVELLSHSKAWPSGWQQLLTQTLRSEICTLDVHLAEMPASVCLMWCGCVLPSITAVARLLCCVPQGLMCMGVCVMQCAARIICLGVAGAGVWYGRMCTAWRPYSTSLFRRLPGPAYLGSDVICPALGCRSCLLLADSPYWGAAAVWLGA